MNARALLLLVGGALVSGPSAVTAQLALAPGARVRVTTANGPRPLVGTLLGASADSLRLHLLVYSNRVAQYVETDTALARRSVTRIEVSQGRHNRAAHGAVLGGAIGGGIFLALSLAAMSENTSDSYFEVTAEDVPLYTLGGAVMGAGVGAIIGTLSHRDTWAEVPSEPRPGVAVGVSRGRLEVGVSLRF